WGRIARLFLRELPRENIYGIDVVEDLVDICKETFRSGNFQVTTAFPPTSLPDGHFQFVVGYSVFSHLSEDACSRWMSEFHRVLAPGGLVALTTRGLTFLDFCRSLRSRDHPGYLGALSRVFDDLDAAAAHYLSGEFVHSNGRCLDG